MAVADLDASIASWSRGLGLEVVHRERVDEQGVDEVLLRVGGSFLQLVAPLGPETPVGRFLAKRGPGLHHVGYRVVSVAAAIERVRSSGLRLIDEAPRRGSRGTTIAFVHPSSFGGVLVELVEEPPATRG